MKKVKLSNNIFVNGFTQALNKLLDQPITPAQGFYLMKFARQVADKQEIFFKEKEKMVKKYGVEDPENKGSYTIKPEDREKVEADWSELLAIKETYEVEPIRLKDDVTITTKELMLLEDILIA